MLSSVLASPLPPRPPPLTENPAKLNGHLDIFTSWGNVPTRLGSSLLKPCETALPQATSWHSVPAARRAGNLSSCQAPKPHAVTSNLPLLPRPQKSIPPPPPPPPGIRSS